MSRLALVSPVPPDATGIAAYTWDLANALAAHVGVDLYYERTPSVMPESDIRLMPITELPWAIDNGTPLYVIANSALHLQTWLAFASWGGDVLLHDVRLLALYRELVREGLMPYASLESVIWAVDGQLLPPGLRNARPRPLGERECILYGVTLVGHVVDRARRVLVHSQLARELVLKVRPDREADVRVLPFPVITRPRVERCEDREPLVAMFGIPKLGRLFVEAAARVAAQLPAVRFMFAGSIPERIQAGRLAHLVRARGLEDRFVPVHEQSAWLSDSTYEELLTRATVAVQPREHFYGETSGTTRRDSLSAGIPTIVNRIGTQAEIPESVVVHVSTRPSPDELAAAIVSLLDDSRRRSALREAALRYTAEHSFARTAKCMLDAISN